MINEVRQALKEVVAGCFSPPIDPLTIQGIIPRPAGNNRDTDYPKVFVVADGGIFADVASQQQERLLGFFVVVVYKKLPSLADPAAAIETFVDLLDKKILANYTLGDTAAACRIAEYETDSGAWAPEACVVVKLEVTAVIRR